MVVPFVSIFSEIIEYFISINSVNPGGKLRVAAAFKLFNTRNHSFYGVFQDIFTIGNRDRGVFFIHVFEGFFQENSELVAKMVLFNHTSFTRFILISRLNTWVFDHEITFIRSRFLTAAIP